LTHTSTATASVITYKPSSSTMRCQQNATCSAPGVTVGGYILFPPLSRAALLLAQ
jgi:hypothetical protein